MGVTIFEDGANGRLNNRRPTPFNVGNAGASGDGQTDDYRAIKDASDSQGSVGGIYFPPGTYRVGTNLTINCEAIFALGATLEPDAGVTVTLAGPVTTAPGASIIASGAAGTVSITGPTNGSGVLDVRTFGAVGDGVTDDTAAIKKALQAARPGGTVFLPAPSVGYLIDPVRNPGSGTPGGAQIHVPAGVTLAGTGYASVLLVDPTKFVQDGRHHIITFDSDATLRDFRLNGRKDEVNRSGLTDLQVYAIYAAKDGTTPGEVERATLYNLYVHDIIGINQESFGAMVTRGCADCVFRDVTAWNVEGTGIAISGNINTTDPDWTDADMSERILVIGCRGFNNEWAGISCYGTRAAEIIGGWWYDNGQVGLNVEWSVETQVLGAKAYSNAAAGFRTIGPVRVTLSGCEIFDNTQDPASPYSYASEILVHPGSWFTGSPRPRGNAEVVVIDHCTVVRGDNSSYELAVRGSNTTQTTIGTGVPREVVLRQPDAVDWAIDSPGAVTGQPSQLPCISLQEVGGFRFTSFGPLSGLTPGGGATIGAYAGTGNTNPDAITITSTAQFHGFRTPLILKAGCWYKMRIRAKVDASGPDWQVRLRNAADDQRIGRILFPGNAWTAGEWLAHEQVIKIPDDENYQIAGFQVDVGSSTFSIDYLEVYEIGGSPIVSGESQRGVQSRGNENATLIAGRDAKAQVWGATLNTARTVTLSTTGAFAGATFRIVRTAAATGSDPLNVGTGPLKALSAGEWCEVTFDGSAWLLTAFGTL